MSKLIIPKYCDANSILLINRIGTMRKLYCPFQVKAAEDLNNLKKGAILWVEQVAANERDELIYWILGKPCNYTHFEIVATF